jgi:hypothetical protein
VLMRDKLHVLTFLPSLFPITYNPSGAPQRARSDAQMPAA